MFAPSPASAVSDSIAELPSSSKDLHHHDWLVLQTGLGHAPRAVLHTIVQQHAGFQRNSDDSTFFMLRSRLESVLPRGMCWRTFTNHRSALVKLGLLELVWRAPNQHTDRSLWRIRYDQIMSAHPSEQLALPLDDVGSRGDHTGEGFLTADTAGVDAVQEERIAPSPVPPSSSSERHSLLQQIAQMKGWLARLKAQLEALVSAELEPEGEGDVAEGSPLPRAERRRRERRAAKRARSATASSFMQSVVAKMKELGISPADEDLLRFKEVEALWLELHSGDLPGHFLTYAIERMHEAKPERPIGYIVGVLRSTVEKGYTESMPSGKRMVYERYAVRNKNY